jgi:hypothetical protein
MKEVDPLLIDAFTTTVITVGISTPSRVEVELGAAIDPRLPTQALPVLNRGIANMLSPGEEWRDSPLCTPAESLCRYVSELPTTPDDIAQTRLVGGAATALANLGSRLLRTSIDAEQTAAAYTAIARGFRLLEQTDRETSVLEIATVAEKQSRLRRNLQYESWFSRSNTQCYASSPKTMRAKVRAAQDAIGPDDAQPAAGRMSKLRSWLT